MNIEDCEECKWMGYESIEGICVCMLFDEKPIEDIEYCDPKNLTSEQEYLIIEGDKEK